MEASPRQISKLCYQLHQAKLLRVRMRDNVNYMKEDFANWAAENLQSDTASDLIDALIKYDCGTGDESQRAYIEGQLKHLGYDI